MEPILRVVGFLLLLVSPQDSRAQEPCTLEPTFESLRCRLAELTADTTTALDSGALRHGDALHERLLRQLERAGLRFDAGDELCVAGDTRRARSSLRRAIRGLILFRHTLGLKVGRATVPSETRERLRNDASELSEDMRLFRTGLVCPPASTTTTTPPGTSTTTTSQTTTSSTTSTLLTSTTTIGASTSTTIATTSTTSTQTTTTATSTIVSTTSVPATTTTSTTSVTTTTEPPAGAVVALVVTLTHDPVLTGDVAGVEITVDYDPAKVSIPGSGNLPTDRGRVENLGPVDAQFSVSDRDTGADGEDDQVFIPYGTLGIIPPGDIVRVIFDGALGTTITETDFTCTVETAVDGLGTPVGGITCGVSVMVTSSTTTTTTEPVTTTATTTTVTTTAPTSTVSTTSIPPTTNTSTTTTTTTSVTTTTGQAVCGDGVPEGDEECDDGNDVNTDACTQACEDARCGDGFTWQDVEQCDDGNQVNDDFCQNDCHFVPALCGDGVRQFGETCDDHNTTDGDDCPPDCRIESCVPTGTRHLVAVTFTPPGGVSVGGLVVFIHYPDGTVGIPGLGNATQVRARILNLQPGFTHVSNELDYAIRETIAPTLPNTAPTPGEIFRVSFDLCFGATAPPPASFTCMVESASTPQGGDIDLGLNPITCAVTGT